MRRYVTVRCPTGHEYKTMWDNFCPKNGMPKRGCAECHYTKIGKLTCDDITKWAENAGVIPLETYKKISTPMMWKCPKDHQFKASFAAIRQRRTPCIQCAIKNIEVVNNLELLSKWDDTCKSTTSLMWVCKKCNNRFMMTLISSFRHKSMCPSCE